MADLDFSHNVSEIPAQPIPAPYHRTEKVDVTHFPDMQSTLNNYAENSNWMSFIGSNIAAASSNAVAQKIGGELGKSPQGDLGIPLTDFDRTMQESYRTQSQATLGIQANKLISDANIEASKADRVTPDLIRKTNETISLGLQNIFQNAPSEIRPHLEYQYGTVQLNQHADLEQRMLREQKQDRQNNTALASQTNAEHAYSFGLRGDDKAGQAAIETTRRLAEADVASRLMTPQDAKANVDTARKSFLSGKVINEYEKARAQGKEAEYLKSLADKKPSYLSDEDYLSVTNNLMTYVNHQDALRSQDQQLRLAKFNVSLAQNPLSPDMPQQIQELKNNLSPAEYEKAHLSYIDALTKFNKDNGDFTNALTSWNDPSSFSRLSEKGINRAFDMMVGQRIQQGQQSGRPVSRDDAEVEVAASAGGMIPVFTKSLNNKFASANPVNIESAGRQVERLTEMNAGNILQGISPESRAVYTKYQALRDSMDAQKAALLAHETVYNQDIDVVKANNEKWTNFLSTKKPQGQTPDVFALKQVGLDDTKMRAPTVYGNDILEEYKTYFTMLNGDQVSAKKMLQESVDRNYGATMINGKHEITKHPIEKVLNLPSDAIGSVQQDISEHLQNVFNEAKQKYDAKQVNEYWEVAPRITSHEIVAAREKEQSQRLKSGAKKDSMIYQSASFGQIQKYNKGAPIEVIRHMRGGKSQKYNVVIQMNPFASLTGNESNPIQGGWDVSVDSGSGLRNLYREAPYLGLVTYTPNLKSIQANRAALLRKG